MSSEQVAVHDPVARRLIEEHIRQCNAREEFAHDDVKALRNDISKGFQRVHDRIDEHNKNINAVAASLHKRVNATDRWISRRLLVLAAAIIMLLLGILGYLLAHGNPWEETIHDRVTIEGQRMNNLERRLEQFEKKEPTYHANH